METKKKIGVKLKEIREQRGYTLKQLASKLGTVYQTIHRWEKGKGGIPSTKLGKVCEVLNISPSYLLGEEPTTIEYPFEFLTSKKKINIKEFMPAGANYLLMEVKDNGMKCLQIEKNDLAIIDTNNQQINADSIYAVMIEEKIFLRKVKKFKNEIVIVSCNSTQCGICIYHKSEVDIVGKVIRIIRKL